MDKRAFKQRIQNLKSYRENNPGKGYIEFMEDLAKFKAKEWGENEDIILTEMLNDNTYNYKQMYEDNPNYNIQEGHFQDTYKTVYHPTFSKESMYSGKKSQYNPEGITGGWWDYNNKIFHAGYKQDIRNTQKYLNQEDPGWKVKAFQDGGEASDPKKEKFFQATGRSSSGRPLEEGLKPVFSLEDAANMTPIGDAISARDTYNAVKNRDWLSAGLAALTVLPFVPSGLRNVKAAARYIPTVNRTEQSLINQALGNISKKRDYLSDIANSRNRVLEDINTIPYRNRAEQADKIFGTNYSETYDLLDDLYQHRYFDLPEVQPKDMVASGRLQAKPFAEERFNKTGVGAEPNEFDLWVNTGMYRDPMQLANHEMNHYTDYIISRNANTTINNNMLKQLENSLKQTDATSYYRKGTEQKAYMNQLRTMLKQNADVQNLDEPVSSTLLKKYLDKMSDSDPIKKMFKQHKNINAYTKWFNTIPLLGTTALGANAYFNNNKDE